MGWCNKTMEDENLVQPHDSTFWDNERRVDTTLE